MDGLHLDPQRSYINSSVIYSFQIFWNEKTLNHNGLRNVLGSITQGTLAKVREESVYNTGIFRGFYIKFKFKNKPITAVTVIFSICLIHFESSSIFLCL